MTHPLHPDFLTRPLAHRGLHDASRGVMENTRDAFIAAIDAGYGIELDVQLSADGHAVVFHDEWLYRLTGQDGCVTDRTAHELALIRVGAGQNRIETLQDILRLVGGRVPVLIEIKDQSLTLSQTNGLLERAVAAAVLGYAGPVAVMSFNPHAMDHFKQHAPDVSRGLTTCGFAANDWPEVAQGRCAELADIPDFERLDASFISHDVNDLENASVMRIQDLGYPILCWTVKSADQEKQARKICDNVTFEGYLA